MKKKNVHKETTRKTLVQLCLMDIQRRFIENGYKKSGLGIKDIAEKYHVALPPFDYYATLLHHEITEECAEAVINSLYQYNKGRAEKRNEESPLPFPEPPKEEPHECKKASAQACLDFDTPDILLRIAVALESIADHLDVLTNCVESVGFWSQNDGKFNETGKSFQIMIHEPQ